MPRKNVAGIPASDPSVPAVELKLGGAVYSLCFDFNAIAEHEAATGENLLELITFDNMSATKLRSLLYVALLKAHPQMTLHGAGALIRGRDLGRITQAIMRAWMDSQPEPEEVDEQLPNAGEPAAAS